MTRRPDEARRTPIALHVIFLRPGCGSYVVAIHDTAEGEFESLQAPTLAEAWVQGACAAALVAWELRQQATNDPVIVVASNQSHLRRWWGNPWTGDTGRMVRRVRSLGLDVRFRDTDTRFSPKEIGVLEQVALGEEGEVHAPLTSDTRPVLARIGLCPFRGPW